MQNKIYIAKVIWYPGEMDHPGPATENMVVAAPSYSEAAEYIANYFDESLVENIDITCLNPEGSHVLITQDVFEGLKECEI